MQKKDYEEMYELEENLWWFVGMRAITAALLVDAGINGRGRLRVLDAGCGTGSNLTWLRRYSDQIYGIDYSAHALKFCRRRNHPLLASASVTSLPFADGSFDVVTCFDVLPQLPRPDGDEKALREFHRVLADSGLLFIRAAAYQWLYSGHDIALATQQRYSLTALCNLIESAGFRILRRTYANALLLPAAVVQRLLLKPAGLADGGSDVKRLPRGLSGLDTLFKRALLLERWWLGRKIDLPFGLSAICIAQKQQ